MAFRLNRFPYYDITKEERYQKFKIKYPYYSCDDIVTFVNIGLDKPFYSDINKIMDSGSITVLVNKYKQLEDTYVPNDLELIAPCYNEGELVLRNEARRAFELMCCCAAVEGVRLKAISTYRSFNYQNTVYYKNMTPEICLEDYQKIRDKVSARPGHSEHQTGLAVDINELEQSFEDTPAGKWLAANSYRYGYLLRYPKGKEEITGYDYEPWHFRYLGKKMAINVTVSQLTYDEYYVRYLKQKLE